MLAAIAGPAQAQHVEAAAFDGIPGVTVAYYDVAGTDLPTIRAAMLESRPTDPNDGLRVDALTRTQLRWSWPLSASGCQLQEARISFRATVTLPRLANAAVVPADIQASWATYLAQIEAHELTHLRYGYDGQAALLAAIKGATCETANAAARAVLAEIQQRDIVLDRSTHHGDRDAEAVFQNGPSHARAGAR